MNFLNKNFDDLSKNRTIKIYLFILLVLLSIFLRVYKLDHVPNGLYEDETAIGYNAFSILQTGKDEYGISHPLYFKSFDDYKLPAYIYTTAAFEKFLGLNEYAVRLPSAITGALSVVLFFFLIRYLTKNDSHSFIGSFMLAINPLHLQLSRGGFEVNFALAFTLLGVLMFILGAEKRKIYLLVISLLSFGVSLYSYNVTRLLVPLFLLALLFFYFDMLKKLPKKNIIFLLVVLFITLVPFIYTFFTASGVVSAKSSLITSTDILAKNLEMRSYLSTFPSLFVKVLYNKYIFMGFQYLQNLATLLSGTFFFVSGSSNTNQGIGNIGMFYLFELPFFIYGIISYFQRKIKSLRFIMLWLVVCSLVIALSKEVPHATRGYFLIIPGVAFSSLGVYFFINAVILMKDKALKFAISTACMLFILYNLQFYFASYYYRSPILYADAWRLADRNLSLYLVKIAPKYEKVIIDPSTNFIYTSYVFYSKYDPTKFMKTVKRYKDGSLIKARSWGNFEVRNIDWEKEINTGHNLYITSVGKLPKDVAILKTITNPTRYNVLSQHDTIYQSPENDVKYIVIDGDSLKKALMKESEKTRLYTDSP